MVFERFKTALLKRQLERAKGVSKTEQARVKSKISKIKREQMKRDMLLRERLKVAKEQQVLRNKILRAKKIKLSPSEKRALERSLKQKRERNERIGDAAKKISAGIFKGLQATAKFIEESDQTFDSPKRKTTKRAKTKKVMKKSTRRVKKSSRKRSR